VNQTVLNSSFKIKLNHPAEPQTQRSARRVSCLNELFFCHFHFINFFLSIFEVENEEKSLLFQYEHFITLYTDMSDGRQFPQKLDTDDGLKFIRNTIFDFRGTLMSVKKEGKKNFSSFFCETNRLCY
jgi:hypothetical protein